MANLEIPDEAKQAQSVVENLLGDSIIGIYLFGSAAVGGLKPNSDVDILVAVNKPLTCWQRKELVAQLMGVSGAIGNQQFNRPIELTVVAVSDVVPWQSPPRQSLYTVSGCERSLKLDVSRNQCVTLILPLF